MKPFPIRVEKNLESYYAVTWMLHNVCNYNCSFCDPTFKNGNTRWLSLDDNKMIVDKLIVAAQGLPVWIQFTGGEPTLYPEFIELVRYIKSRGCYVALLSNGSRTVRWWKELQESNLVDNLLLTFHPDQGAKAEHHAEVLNLFLKDPTTTTCWITSTKDSIQDSINAHRHLVINTGSEILLKVMDLKGYDIKDFMTRSQELYIKYFKNAIGKLSAKKAPSNIPPEYVISSNVVNVELSDGEIKRMSTQQVIREKYHLYKGWECYIGKHQTYVDRNKMHRGSCFFNTDQYIDLLTEPAEFLSTPVICTMNECLCGADIVAPKSKL